MYPDQGYDTMHFFHVIQGGLTVMAETTVCNVFVDAFVLVQRLKNFPRLSKVLIFII